MGYDWVQQALDKLRDVEPHEVMQVLSGRSRWPRPAVGGEVVRVLTIWGRTRTGRPLVVALKRKDEWDWWILGARALSPAEVAELEAWEARGE